MGESREKIGGCDGKDRIVFPTYRMAGRHLDLLRGKKVSDRVKRVLPREDCLVRCVLTGGHRDLYYWFFVHNQVE